MDINSIIDKYLTSWYPTSIPTTTTSISYINPTYIEGLKLTALQLQQELATQTNSISLYFLSRNARAAAASYTILSNQQLLASITDTYETSFETTAAVSEPLTEFVITATETISSQTSTLTSSINLSHITDEMINSTLLLKKLEWDSNLYAINISVPFNLLFTIFFILLLLSFIIIACLRSKSKYFSICMSAGCLLEAVGYICRSIAHYNWSNPNLFVLQIICLTVSPTFIMASIYYFLSQLIVVYGSNFSLLKPSFISWIFICFDLISLCTQACGGIIAAIALKNFQNTAVGTFIMVAGIGFQVLSMTLFLTFVLNFLRRIYFVSDSRRFNLTEFFALLFNTKNGVKIRQENKLEARYDSRYQELRNRKYFNYMPLIILISSICIYIRCIYRVIELSEGWRGFLITHEPFLLTLDGLMVFCSCLIFVPFHPMLILGKTFNISIKKSLSINEKSHEDNGSFISYNYNEFDDDSSIKKFSDISNIDKNEVHSSSTLSSGTTFNSISLPIKAQIPQENGNNNQNLQYNPYDNYHTNNNQQHQNFNPYNSRDKTYNINNVDQPMTNSISLTSSNSNITNKNSYNHYKESDYINNTKNHTMNTSNSRNSNSSSNNTSTKNSSDQSKTYSNPYLTPTRFAHYNGNNSSTTTNNTPRSDTTNSTPRSNNHDFEFNTYNRQR
ncbi:RSB1 [Candida jiufengensis]|uniref:RSB1 n=1 Tax=Candida jiufengensis TaxID=497108 RepID=UPI00222437C8|nr:RSB1 [Candida jiufengensis]KAI5951681.1 RSB1 [Candida jiufengensis]